MIANLFPLYIFPQGGLSQSVITSVYVGVIVLSFFNLRFGWTYSGLIVPGYLVPLIIIKPWAVSVIIVEAILTYYVVWFISEYTARWGVWSSLFGRDRFFVIVLVSLMIRLVFDGWLLPEIGQFFNHRYALQFDYQNNLHSFGLIIIALIANQLWKPGLKSGLFTFFVTLVITYIIVRYGLMEFTNYSVEKVSLMYEDIAASILASPKAYIIILTASFLASYLNLKYGLEFNGILIPSLLALLWYDPFKIFSTLVEVIVILIGSKFVLKIPLLKNATIEGARKVVVFFSISFFYKMLLGFFILYFFPLTHISDFYGFGYILSTLIAIKMHDKAIVPQMISSILATSLSAVAIATLAGFLLTLLPLLGITGVRLLPDQEQPLLRLSSDKLLQHIFRDKIMLYEKKTPNSVKPATPVELDKFQVALNHLHDYITSKNINALQQASIYLDQVNYELYRVENRYLYLKEKQPANGWGIYALDMTNPSGLVVEVPAPLDELNILEAGLSVFIKQNGYGLAIAGSSRTTNWDGSADVLINPNTFFELFHKIMSDQNVLQMRGYTASTIRPIIGARVQQAALARTQIPSSLWHKNELPNALKLKSLQNMIGKLDINSKEPSFDNIQRQTIWTGFAELLLNRKDCSRLSSHLAAVQSDSFQVQTTFKRIDGYLMQRIMSAKDEIADAGTNLYKPPTRQELLFFDYEVLTPLLQLIEREYVNGELTALGVDQLQTIHQQAVALGYEIIYYCQTVNDEKYFILMESSSRRLPSERTYRGIYVFRLGAANAYTIQVPRPLSERNSFEFGLTLFERLQARALLISSAHDQTNSDGSSDLIRQNNKSNLFNLVSQALMRESGDNPLMTIQCRAFGYKIGRPLIEGDILMATSQGAFNVENWTPLGKKLYGALTIDQLNLHFVDGSPATAGYEIGNLTQSLYLNQAVNKEFTLLWASPLTRNRYRQQADNQLQAAQFDAVNIETVIGDSIGLDLYNYLRQEFSFRTVDLPPAPLVQAVQVYLQYQDINALYALTRQWSEFQYQRFIDPNTGQAFLIIHKDHAAAPFVVNLLPIDPLSRLSVKESELKRSTVEQFINARQAWLVFLVTSQ